MPARRRHAAQQDVINFPRVTSCGTNTEVSLPCMFSPFGRKDYDEKAIHEHESLLHVLERAEFHISWRDNQSGCKGCAKDWSSSALAQARMPHCVTAKGVWTKSCSRVWTQKYSMPMAMW